MKIKKKIYFDNTWNIKNLYIVIVNGKIRQFYGGHYSRVILFGGYIKNELIEIDTDFTLTKVPKYDRKLNGIKANYRIECYYLLQNLIKPTYIRLNIFEKFIIDFSKKETLFQTEKFKLIALTTLIFTIPTSIITTIFTDRINHKTEINKVVKTEVTTDTATVVKK